MQGNSCLVYHFHTLDGRVGGQAGGLDFRVDDVLVGEQDIVGGKRFAVRLAEIRFEPPSHRPAVGRHAAVLDAWDLGG